MKTESHSINDVLAKNATSFFIPPFQRAYAWGRSEIERYFDDIIRIIKSELDDKQHDKLEHFFGTVVIKEEKDGFANISIVVDGQQRLTTTLIFLIALRDLEEDQEHKDYIMQNYLINNSSKFQDKIKLKQVTKDWDAYCALINNTTQKQGIIYNAYQLFTKLIIDKRKKEPNIKLEHYILAIQRINVAVIFLDERPFKGEDPQIIFETLNSLGKPLTLSDLIRNYVLLNMDSNNQSDIYEKIWYPKIEAILGENTSEFFRDYLQLRTNRSIKVVSDNNTKEVYQLFKSFVGETFNSHDEFIKDIVRYVIWYKWIITEVVTDQISSDTTKNNEIKELIRNIFHDIKSEAFKPFVLGILEYHDNKSINDDLLISILQNIRTYLIRRRIVGLTQGENKNIVLLSSYIERLAHGNVTMLDLLCGMFYRMRFPNDEEVKNQLISLNFYEGLKKYSKFILGKIEEHNTKVSVDFRNSKITIEHIMPQKPDNAWKEDLGDNFENVHKTYLHNIGNLILTEFNSEIGNKSFSEKKVKLSTSSLSLRLPIINKTIWNEDSIKEHQLYMINCLLGTFPLPDEYKEKSNWNTKNDSEDTITTIFPLDDADSVAWRKPKELHIENIVEKVKTWQDVFIKFVKYIIDTKDYDFDIIQNNQNELFNRDNVFVKYGTLKKLIDVHSDLMNRYKTVDGKICDKVENVNDDVLFIHVNISASVCMNRIAIIMNKFNLPEDSVKIILK